jgi:hypothetical protein
VYPGGSARDGGQRLGQRERAGVERLADDGALDAERDELGERAQVVQRRDAAARDDGPVGAAQTSRSSSTFGPVSVPSRLTSVTT